MASDYVLVCHDFAQEVGRGIRSSRCSPSHSVRPPQGCMGAWCRWCGSEWADIALPEVDTQEDGDQRRETAARFLRSPVSGRGQIWRSAQGEISARSSHFSPRTQSSHAPN